MRVSVQVRLSVEAFGPFKTLSETKLEDFKVSMETIHKILAVVMKSMPNLAAERITMKTDTGLGPTSTASAFTRISRKQWKSTKRMEIRCGWMLLN
jgi:L-2-hydroxyglutarate oxidase LhgO